MPKKLVGHVGVDSGCLMLVDPCYVKDYPEIYCHGQKVDKSGKLEWNKTEGLPHLWNEFCKGLNRETPDLMCGGVVTHTRYGDGEFPVYAHFNKHGEIMKLEVRLY